MTVNNVAVMRRREDSWLNATQILKVAGVEKGKRTKVLEKEILSGKHEKVQGGYGKYQGTWSVMLSCTLHHSLMHLQDRLSAWSRVLPCLRRRGPACTIVGPGYYVGRRNRFDPHQGTSNGSEAQEDV
jgi:hypothetical protein